MEIGIYTFGDLPAHARGPQAARQRLQEIIAAAKPRQIWNARGLLLNTAASWFIFVFS